MTRPHVKSMRQKLLKALRVFKKYPCGEHYSREDLIEAYHYYVYLKRSTSKFPDAPYVKCHHG